MSLLVSLSKGVQNREGGEQGKGAHPWTTSPGPHLSCWHWDAAVLTAKGVLLPPSQVVLFSAAFLEESHLTSAAFPFPFQFPLPTLQITVFLKIAGVSSSLSPTARLVV